jgi:hypothetical protein
MNSPRAGLTELVSAELPEPLLRLVEGFVFRLEGFEVRLQSSQIEIRRGAWRVDDFPDANPFGPAVPILRTD